LQSPYKGKSIEAKVNAGQTLVIPIKKLDVSYSFQLSSNFSLITQREQSKNYHSGI